MIQPLKIKQFFFSKIKLNCDGFLTNVVKHTTFSLKNNTKFTMFVKMLLFCDISENVVVCIQTCHLYTCVVKFCGICIMINNVSH